MKKMSLLVAALTTLSFSTFYSIEKKDAAIFGACLFMGAAGSYYYHNYYKPAQPITNEPTNKKETISPLRKELLITETDTAKAELFIVQTTNNTTPKITEKTNLLNNVANLVKTINLEKLLEENMEILEG